MDKEDVKKAAKELAKGSRRFSKTIPSTSGSGQRNKKATETMIIKKMTKFADQLVQDQTIETESEILKKYNTYYFQNAYNAFDVNNVVDGNLLTFNLIYCYKKFDWKNKIPELDEQLFKNLAYRL